jgi:hypothetical protein
MDGSDLDGVELEGVEASEGALLPTPTGLTVATGLFGFRTTWSAVSGANRYQVSYADTNTGEPAVVGYTNALEAPRFPSEWVPGHTYKFTVKAQTVNSSGAVTNESAAVFAFNVNTRPTVTNLYIIQNQNLYRVDRDTGLWVQMNNRDWTGATAMSWQPATITGEGWVDCLYIIQNGHLLRVRMDRGTVNDLGDGWDQAANMTWGPTGVWAIKDGTIVSVMPGGGTSAEGGPEWGGATGFMYAFNPNTWPTFDVIKNSHMYRYGGPDYSAVDLGSGWGGSVYLTHANTNDDLAGYVTQAGSLWRVDDMTGAFQRVGMANFWPNVRAMAGFRGWLYIIQDSKLWRVNRTDGSAGAMHGGALDWGGNVLMTPGGF